MSEVIKSKIKKLFKKAKKGKTKSNNVVPLKRNLRVVSNTSNPVNFEEICESERRYLNSYFKHPFKTDLNYFLKAFYNILIKRKRSR